MPNNYLKIFTSALQITLSVVLVVGLMLMPYPSTTATAQTSTTSPASLDTTVETGAAAAVTESYTIENTNDADTVAQSSSTATSSSTDTTGSNDISTSTPQLAGTKNSATTSATGTESAIEPVADSNPTTATASSSPEQLATKPAATTSASSTVAVEIVQAATASTSGTTTATTGDNNAATPTGTAAINTGDAYAYSNVVNLTNTNIIDSTGFIVFLNQLFGIGDADIRDMFDVFTNNTSSSPCSDSACEAQTLSYHADSQSNIANNVVVSADSGNNQASGTKALITTGDAYAAANVTNVTNTNLVDANYLVLTFSNFGDLLGDIVLPGQELLTQLFQVSGDSGGQTISSNSTATISNDVAVEANTGNNTATGTSSAIQTGDATTYSNVYNQTNTNAINSDSITMLFRVSGDWAGEVYGLPDGLSWERTGNGIAISNDPNLGQTAVSTRTIDAKLTSTATIDNNVSVTASTGNNQTNADKEGYIETGDAYAAASVTNVANTNILGRNWSLLIFDIFGNWEGDISFGQPDLWIGGVANAHNGTTGAGQAVTYTFTISNLGDATASGVTLNGNLDSNLITLDKPMDNIYLGSIAPGETIKKTVSAQVVDSLSQGSHPIDLTASLSGNEPDGNMTNNTEIVTIMAENIRRSGGGSSGIRATDIRPAADLAITKTAVDSSVSPGEITSYEVSVSNSGGPVFGAMLYDNLHNPAGEIISSQQWDLGTIDPNETVVVTYDTEFASTTAVGTYINRAQILGYHRNRKPEFMQPYDSMVATVATEITSASPLVLGIATSTTQCDPYLTTFLKQNQTNDPSEVTKLQSFLNNHTTPAVVTTGVFDQDTATAVQNFQRQHAADILDPWGITNPTGYVYYTTKKKINELYCNEQKEFPLTPTQLSEINQFRFAGVSQPPITKPAPSVPEQPKQVTNQTAPTTPPKPTLIPVARAEQVTPATSVSASDDSNIGLIDRVTQWITRPNLSTLKFWER